MVMFLRGFTPDMVALDAEGNVVPGAVGVVYTSYTGSTIFNSTFAADPEDLAVGVATGGEVTADADGYFGFYTENNSDPLYLEANGRRLIVGVSRIDDLVGSLVTDAVAPIADQITGIEESATTGLARADQALAENDAQDVELEDLSARVDDALTRVNVLNFGAVADGITNDQPAFVAAMAAVESLGGGELYVPSGTYVIDGVVELVSGVRIKGEGLTSRLMKTVGSPYSYFVALSHGDTGYGSSVRDVHADGLTFLGDFDTDMGICGFALHHAQNVIIENCNFEQAQGVGHCIDLCGCDNVTVRNCDFLGFNNSSTDGFNRTEAIEIDVSAPGSVSFTDDAGSYDLLLCSNITVDHCRFLPITVGATTYPCPNPMGAHAQVEGKAYTGIRFTNNYVLDPTQHNPVDSSDNGFLVGVLHFPCTQGLWIENNTIIQTQSRSQRVISVVSMSEGITAASDPDAPTTGAWAAAVQSKDIFIRGNTIKGFKPPVSGTEAYTLFLRGVTGGYLENVHVEGNAITDGYQVTGDLGGRAIFLRNITRSEVRANSIDSYKYGIDLNGGDTVSISGNQIDRAYWWPVIIAAAAGVAVSGNSVYRSKKPMQSQSDTTEVSFTGNTHTDPAVTGNDAAGIVCAGTRSSVVGNVIRNSSGTQPRGIAMNTATSAGNVCVGNVATGYTTSVSPAAAPAGTPPTLYAANTPVPV